MLNGNPTIKESPEGLVLLRTTTTAVAGIRGTMDLPRFYGPV